jgi:hypothetical protein
MKIHLKSRQGLYTVEQYGRESITMSTKHGIISVPTSDFKAMAGGAWNNDVPKEKIDLFLSVVCPEHYRMQVEQEDQILSLAARIDIVNKAKESLIATMETINVLPDDKSVLDYKNEIKDWENRWSYMNEKYTTLNHKMRHIASQVYSQTLDYSNFVMTEGVKFIIQQHYHDDSYRFCWDPYGFVSNGHSDISDLYRDGTHGTVNGGWIKVFEKDVVLYYKSGDYGVYDDAVAIAAATSLFPGKKIHSFAGRQWDDELNDMFYDLPF